MESTPLKDFYTARRLKWQAEGLMIRLDDLGIAENSNANRWTKINHARRSAFARVLRRERAHALAFNALKAS